VVEIDEELQDIFKLPTDQLEFLKMVANIVVCGYEQKFERGAKTNGRNGI